MSKNLVLATDLSDVLISGLSQMSEHIFEAFLPSYVEQFGEERGIKEAKSLCDFIMDGFAKNSKDYRELLRGHLTEDECWMRMFGDQSTVIAGLKRALSANFKMSIPGTLKLYQRIIRYPTHISLTPGEKVPMRDGMPEIVIVSDHISERINELKADHPEIFRITSDQYWSCDLGMVKCDPDFFPKLLEDLDREPDEVLFVDDSRLNVISAESSKIHSVVFSNSKQLETVLREAYGFVFAPEF